MARGKPSERTDQEKVDHFAYIVDQCWSSTAVTQGTLRAKFSLNSTLGGPLEITTDLGDIDHVRSLTLTVRQLLAPQEDSHFERVSKILYKRLTDDELRTYSVNNSAEWKQMQEGDILLKQNDQPMRGRQLLDIWINGVAFHGGKKELDLYLSLQEPLRSMFQQQVNSLLMDCLNISRQQRNVIREAYERSAFKFD
jgi:hypothetical protein